MRRFFIVLSIILLSTLLMHSVSGTTYVWNFDRQQWILISPSNYSVEAATITVNFYSTTISLPSPGYPVFLFISVTSKALVNPYVPKMDIYVKSGESMVLSTTLPANGTFYIPLPPKYTSTVAIEIELEGSGDVNKVAITTLHKLMLLVVDDYGYSYNTSIQLNEKTPLTPAGKGGAGLALDLDKVELSLTNPMNLSEGSLGLQLLWDGNPVNITPWLTINASGYLYMHFGQTKYVFPHPLNVSTWEDVYIGWEQGNAYLAVGSLEVTFAGFNWTIQMTHIGSLFQETNTLIDTLVLSSSYLPPENLQNLLGLNSYYILYKNTTIKIIPEGGTQLGTLQVSFLSKNLTPINSTTIDAELISTTAPSEAKYLIISSPSGISRIYTLPATDITFPSVNAQVTIAKITVTPGTWQSVLVKTPSGKVAYSGPLQDDSFKFAAIPGQTYLLTFRSGNISVTRITVITGDTVFYVAKASSIIKPPLSITAYYKDNNIVVEYYDAQNETKKLNVTISIYNQFRLSHTENISEQGPFGYYRFVVPVANTSDYAKITVKALINGTWETYEKTVIINQVGGKSPFPPNLIPTAFVVLGAAIVPLFLSRGTEPWLMLIGGSVGLTLVMLMGWVQATPVVKMLAAALAVLGVLAMLARRW